MGGDKPDHGKDSDVETDSWETVDSVPTSERSSVPSAPAMTVASTTTPDVKTRSGTQSSEINGDAKSSSLSTLERIPLVSFDSSPSPMASLAIATEISTATSTTLGGQDTGDRKSVSTGSVVPRPSLIDHRDSDQVLNTTLMGTCAVMSQPPPPATVTASAAASTVQVALPSTPVVVPSPITMEQVVHTVWPIERAASRGDWYGSGFVPQLATLLRDTLGYPADVELVRNTWKRDFDSRRSMWQGHLNPIVFSELCNWHEFDQGATPAIPAIRSTTPDPSTLCHARSEAGLSAAMASMVSTTITTISRKRRALVEIEPSEYNARFEIEPSESNDSEDDQGDDGEHVISIPRRWEPAPIQVSYRWAPIVRLGDRFVMYGIPSVHRSLSAQQRACNALRLCVSQLRRHADYLDRSDLF
jgi:hypothetical protein